MRFHRAVYIIGRGTTRDRRRSIFRVERIHGSHDLGEIVFGFRRVFLVLDSLKSREQKSRKNPDHGDDNEQLH